MSEERELLKKCLIIIKDEYEYESIHDDLIKEIEEYLYKKEQEPNAYICHINEYNGHEAEDCLVFCKEHMNHFNKKYLTFTPLYLKGK